VNAIEILVEEHHLILRGLDLLTTAAERIVRNQHPPKEFFEKAVSFTFHFTNKFHHYKEEIVMFGMLAQKREGDIDAEIERLRDQHRALHDYMNEISHSIDAYSENMESEVRRLHRNLSDYIETLHRHVNAENGIFYPLVAKTLTGDEMRWLAEEFEKYAANEGPDAMNVYAGVIDEMGELLQRTV
jgi:hemerythrin-like domain-containing protein